MPHTPQRNGDGKDSLLDRQWSRGPALWGSRTKQNDQGDQPTRPPLWPRGRVEGFPFNLPAMVKATPALRLIRALVEASRLLGIMEDSDAAAPRTLKGTPTITRARTAQRAPSPQGKYASEDSGSVPDGASPPRPLS